MDRNHDTWRQRAANLQAEVISARMDTIDAIRTARAYRLIALGGWIVAVVALAFGGAV